MPLRSNLRQAARRVLESGKARVFAIACVVAFGAASTGVDAARAQAQGSGKRGGEQRPDLLYHNYCSVCHGDRGDGQSRARNSLVPPPKDFTSAAAIAELTRDRMIAATTVGKPGTAMVGWSTQLGPKEVEAVVDYVIATFMAPRTTPAFARGRELYGRLCVSCHGVQGQGGAHANAGSPPPRNFGTPQAVAELGRERMLASVTHGRPGTAMASFASQLAPADVGAVVDYIRVAFMGASPADVSGTSAHRGRGADAAGAPGPHGDAGAAPHGGTPQGAAPAVATRADQSLPFPNHLAGNAARGRKFYDENCATCHGVKGDAQGPRAYFIRPKPRNFVSDESRAMFNRPALFAAVSQGRLGSEMPAWSKVIDDQKIADVAEYVFQAFIAGPRPPARAAASTPR